MKKNQINVALLQLKNRIDDVNGSYHQAESLIKQIYHDVDMVFLPELSPRGYAANSISWHYNESMEATTIKWAKTLSLRYGIYIGFGWIQWDKHDVYNSYSIVDPHGTLLGTVRKQYAECYIFKPQKGPKFIDTPIGRIGIAICADSHQISVYSQLEKSNLDFLVLPHAWPVAKKETKIIHPQDIHEGKKLLDTFPYLYSKTLKIPTLFVNTIGPMQKMKGLLGLLMTQESFSFLGRSKIIDENGQVLASLDSEENFIMAALHISHPKRENIRPKIYQRGWLHKGSSMLRYLIIPIDKIGGAISYRLHKKTRCRP